jgi:nucleotide-binding universal stress UspA family protein
MGPAPARTRNYGQDRAADLHGVGDEAGADVTAAAEAFTRAGIKAHGVVRDTLFGHAAREIIRDAAEHDAGVIVMGSRGRGDLAGLVLGSTATKSFT